MRGIDSWTFVTAGCQVATVKGSTKQYKS